MPLDAQTFRMLLAFAWEAITFRSGRSFLTAVGMAAGTASVVAVVSIGMAGRSYVVGLIEGMGSNLVVARGTGDGINPEFITFDDADALALSLGSLGTVAPMVEVSQTLSIAGEPWPIKVIGVTPEYASVRNLVVRRGRFLGAPEESGAAKVVLISQDLARRLYGDRVPEDASLRLFDLRFRVIGVFQEAVGTAAAVNRSEAAGLTALIPYSTLRQLYNTREVDVVYVQASSPGAIPQLIGLAEHVLSSRHESMESIEVESLTPFINLARAVSGAIGLVLLAIAGVSLIVAGIGIMNIMLVTVRERTRDIGIRLAVGARRSDILTQFLLEAALLSTVGGVLGVVLGGGLPLLVGSLLGITVPVSILSIATAFLVCVTVGLVFGVHPARKAASMNIVDALDYE